MGTSDDYFYLPIRDACYCINQKVNIIANVLEFNLPKTTSGTDFCCTLRIIDETYNETGLSVNFFAEKAESLPHVGAIGDIVQLAHVTVEAHGGEVNAVFDKRFSSFALYKAYFDYDFIPYQVSSKFHPTDEDKMFVAKLRKWLINFQLHEVSSYFPMFREIKEGHINLACKILHCCEAEKDKWFIFAWDGTDAPLTAICSRLEDEWNSPLPLRLEPLPLPRELLCTFPTVGSILRIIVEKEAVGLGVGENHLLDNIGKWVKFVNLRLEVHAGLWCGVFTPFTKLRYTPNEDCLVVKRKRLYDERMSLNSGIISSFCFPMSSFITVVKHDRVPCVTLMEVLTHSEVLAKFKCIVRVVAAVPFKAENIRNPDGMYRMRLILEDPTARIHALVIDEEGETLFGGYPGIGETTKKLKALLGKTECDDNAARNPPWAWVCLFTHKLTKPNDLGSRDFFVFDTKIVGDDV